jgi:hypothetical protein
VAVCHSITPCVLHYAVVFVYRTDHDVVRAMYVACFEYLRYCRLSVNTQLLSKVEHVMKVARNNFRSVGNIVFAVVGCVHCTTISTRMLLNVCVNLTAPPPRPQRAAAGGAGIALSRKCNLFSLYD